MKIIDKISCPSNYCCFYCKNWLDYTKIIGEHCKHKHEEEIRYITDYQTWHFKTAFRYDPYLHAKNLL